MSKDKKKEVSVPRRLGRDAWQALSQARLAIRMHPEYKYYAHGTLYLNAFADDGQKTMAVDADGNCAINEKWFLEQPEYERALCVLEATEHLIREHARRLVFADRSVADKIADIQVHDGWMVNGLTVKDDQWSSVRLANEYKFKFKKPTYEMSLEEMMAEMPPNVLAALIDEDDTSQNVGLMDGELGNDVGDGDAGGSPVFERQKDVDWNEVTAQCESDAKSMGIGSAPVGAPRPLVYHPPQHDFSQFLWWWTGQAMSDDTSYSKANRRLGWTSALDFIMPGLASNGMTLAAIMDTSGSTSTRDSEKFLSELKGIQDSMHCAVRLFICDAAIQAEHFLNPGDEWPKVAPGGGGTDFSEVFDKLKEDNPDGLVILTDGYVGNIPEKQPPYPVLTVTTAVPFPWGENVNFDNRNED